MTDKQKRDYLPILGNGEQMIEPIKKKMRGVKSHIQEVMMKLKIE
ncbi:hypothetical protein P7H20_23025 [Paenibacillus larvae]|nr:hypothetical protein [Paenibacillus larvae]MDT2277137.1 hypothetical protein [Paenibacillus larvae]MDT2294883.1 hypothetical protein [Paenibacillus larvae]